MKSALITGGSRGIGKAISLALARDHGFHILINYQSNKSAAEEVAQQIISSGGTAEILPFDVANNTQTKKAIEQWLATDEQRKIEVIVNNAGITRDNLLVFTSEHEWDDVVNTSLKGFYNVTQTLMKHMIMNRYGRIVNIVSLSGLKGVPGQTNYSAAKGGVIAATKALAQEVGKRKITVNAVAPGFIKSDMTKGLPEDELKKLVPLQRFGEPEEVASLVSFLVGAEASYITGEVININGGLYS